MSFLRLDHLAKGFGRKQVLTDLSLTVEKGETLAVVGPSGAGKTLLLRLIAGIEQADNGTVAIDGRRVDDLPPAERGVGMAFQNFALYPHLSAFDNIASPLRARRLGDGEVTSRVERITRLLKIDHVLDRLPRQLSNGQKQRTALARALASGAALQMLDDPLRNVDAKLRYEMRFELPRLLKTFGATVLYVTQDYREAMAFGDRIAVLDGGRIRQIGKAEALYNQPDTLGIARLFGDPTINAYETEIAADGSAALLGGRLALGPAFAALKGQSCTLAIRPEHVTVHSDAAAGRIAVELDAVTPLNTKAVLLMRAADGAEILALTEEAGLSRLARRHGTVHIAIDPASIMAFDRASAERLAPRI